MLVIHFPIERCGLEELIRASHVPMQTIASIGSLAEAFPLITTLNPDVLLLDSDIRRKATSRYLNAIRRMSPVRILLLIHSDEQSLHRMAIAAGVHGAIAKSKPVKLIREAIVGLYKKKNYKKLPASGLQ
jgi:DNA-binding NarL/FixJ family response regulator